MTLRPLDEREYCRVWLVQRESDQQYQVIKLVENREALASMRQRAAEQPMEHLIDFHGVIDTSFGPALLAEYCPGGSLGEMVAARGPLPLGEVITALAPIALAVGALHRRGIRHGDISPNNILLTAQGMPKLADFQEVALLADALETAGTPGFIAPEVLHTGVERSPGAEDSYALGACLWYLLSGKVPEAPEFRSPVSLVFTGLPETVLDLLIDALQANPLHRPDPEQFARSLFASGQAEPLNWSQSVPGFATHLMATIHPGPTPRTARWPLRRRPGGEPKPRVRHRRGGEPQSPGSLPVARLLAAVAAVLLVLLAIGLGLRYREGLPQAGTDGQQPSAQPAERCTIQSDAQLPPCAQDATVLLAELVRLSAARDAALNAADATALSRVYAKQSEQLENDMSMLEELGELGMRIRGLHTTLGQLEITARKYPDVVVVAGNSVHNEFSYQQASSPSVAHRVKTGTGERVQFELRHTEQGWVIARVLQRLSESGIVANDDPTEAGRG